jgi:hypothetical protein
MTAASSCLPTSIKAIFAERNIDRISSAELAGALASIEGRPWAEYSRRTGKAISPNQLARLLRSFDIVPGTIRTDTGSTPKGYYLTSFGDAFERYLPPNGVSETPQRHNASAASTSVHSQTAKHESIVADWNCEKPLRHSDCGVVADRNPHSPDERVCAHTARGLRQSAAAGVGQRGGKLGP